MCWDLQQAAVSSRRRSKRRLQGYTRLESNQQPRSCVVLVEIRPSHKAPLLSDEKVCGCPADTRHGTRNCDARFPQARLCCRHAPPPFPSEPAPPTRARRGPFSLIRVHKLTTEIPTRMVTSSATPKPTLGLKLSSRLRASL